MSSTDANASGTGITMWKHIGLHGYAVGTFACDESGIVWKSAVSGRDDASTTRKIPSAKLKSAQWTVFGRSGLVRVQAIASNTSTHSTLRHEYRFDGFPVKDFEVLKDVLKEKYSVDLNILDISSVGAQYGLTKIKNKMLTMNHCILEDDLQEEGQEFEVTEGEQMLSLDLTEVSQCVLPGNNRNEIEIQFPETDTMEAGTDQLVAIRLFIPPDPEADPSDKQAPTAAELLQQTIMQQANIRKTTGDVLVSFDQNKGAFLTPRGRYAIELYATFLRLRGQKYDYKIRYDAINRLFLLPKPDEVHMAFVIALDKPIRQGQQRYQMLILQVSKEPDEVVINLDEETLEKEYNGELQPVMRGSLSNLVAKTFKVIAGKKVFIPGKFANASQQACLSCSVRANEGLLYPLEKQFVFIHKPAIGVRFSEIESVEFQRYAGGQGSTRNFDLQVNLKASDTANKEYTFSGIDRSDYSGLYNFLKSKNIKVKNLEGAEFLSDKRPAAPVYNEDELFGADGGGDAGEDGEEESDDESYGNKDAERDQEPDEDDSDDIDDDEMGSEVDEDLDSDLDEARGTKRSEPVKKGKSGFNDNEDKEGSPRKKKKAKKEKDVNAPKRAQSAYFFFMNSSRELIKEENPEATFGDIGKIAGLKWKALSSEERDRYEKLAHADKSRYAKEMSEYEPPPNSGKKTPVKGRKKGKDPNAPKNPSSSFMFFSQEMRPKIKADNPDISFGDLGKKLGELFRALTPKEKEPYEMKARLDKSRFAKEDASYKASMKQADDDGLDDEDKDDDEDSN